MSVSDNFENIINGTDEGIKGDLFEAIHKNREEMSPEDYKEKTDNTAALGDLMTHIEMMKQGVEVWKTGFTRLDKALGGGFYGEQLIFLGAISSLGKTSFALQIATNIAESGKDVLIFSLEMSKLELNAKTISRYTHIQTLGDEKREKYRLTTRNVLNGEVGDLMQGDPLDEQSQVFKNAFNAAGKIADRVRIYVGEGDISVDTIKEAVDVHIKTTGNKPFVLVDYLQILQASAKAKTAEKRLLTDYDVTILKTIARDYKLPVLVISAFNRTSYLEPVSTSSFRESSGIEYSSDVLLALEFQGMEYQKHYYKDKNSGKLKLVYESEKIHKSRVRELYDEMQKNKDNGLALPITLKTLKTRNDAGKDVYFNFFSRYNYYEEQEKSSYECPSEWIEIEEDETPFSSVSKII